MLRLLDFVEMDDFDANCEVMYNHNLLDIGKVGGIFLLVTKC